MKDYFEYISLVDIALVPVYFFGIIYFQNKMLRIFNVRGVSLLWLIGFNFFYLSISALSFVDNLLPYYPDVELFSKIITSNHFPDYQSEGVKAYFFASFPIRLISLFHVLPHLIIQHAFYFFTLVILWRTFVVADSGFHFFSDRPPKIYFIIGSLYPAAMLFITIPVREYFFLFSFFCLFYGVVLFLKKKANLWPMLLGIGLVLVARPQLIVVVPLFFFIISNRKILTSVIFLPIILFIPLVFSFLTGRSFGPAEFGAVRNALVSTFEQSGQTYGIVSWSTYLDIARDAPLLWSQFMFAPYPILSEAPLSSMKAASLDLFFCVFVIFTALPAIFRNSFSQKIFSLSISVSLFFSIWEFHVADAIRHRLPVILLLLPISSVGIGLIFKKIALKYKRYS